MEPRVRFGASCSPRRTAAARRAVVEDIDDDKADDDPDKLMQCPFDKNHRIRSCRVPYHLIKCRKNHPKLASELKTCPFNARHLVPKNELSRHTETCENRTSVDTEDGEGTSGILNWKVPVSTWVNPNMTEDWEEEADDSAPPFVWGESTVMKDLPETRPVNTLGPSTRPPKSFPWTGL